MEWSITKDFFICPLKKFPLNNLVYFNNVTETDKRLSFVENDYLEEIHIDITGRIDEFSQLIINYGVKELL